MQKLNGIRVLDLTNVLAGPFCCHQLAHLGAEVIKVERPGSGDLARELGADPSLNAGKMGVSFLAQNAGKKSITLDLKSDRGKALLKRLVGDADVLVENFRPGVMDRLGVGWGVLKQTNPQLVYCAISGFGQDGPWKLRPAYDQIIQGASGVMSITGDGQSGPLRVGYPLADTIGGLTAALAIAAALNDREHGVFIDISMLEAVLATMGWAVSNWLIAGVAPTANGNENATSAPSGAFQAADGLINIAANKEEQWRVLAAHLGRADLIERPEFKTRQDRIAHRLDLKRELEDSLRVQSAAVWERELNELGVPAGAVIDVPGILDQDVVASRGMVATFTDVPGVGGDISVLRTGIKLDGEPPAVDTPPPQLGQDNEEIYGALGLSVSEIAQLGTEGVI